jgi:hypothetical protein
MIRNQITCFSNLVSHPAILQNKFISIRLGIFSKHKLKNQVIDDLNGTQNQKKFPVSVVQEPVPADTG